MGSFNTGKRSKRETNLKFSETSVELYENFRSQFNIHHKMLGWDTHRAGIELYMSLEGKAALKDKEIIMNVNGTSNITEMWNALDHAFLPINHHESKYKQFATRRWRFGERMTEYMDELICLFRKAEPGTPLSFQDEEVKNRLLMKLWEKSMGTWTFRLLKSHESTMSSIAKGKLLGRTNLVTVETPLLSVQDKQTGGDDSHTYDEFEQVFAFRDGNCQNRLKDETCTYCNRKGHTEVVCFVKRDDDKLTKMAAKSDVILLKMDSGNAWFADASVNGTNFRFLMDTGASKSVMSSKHFISIPDVFQLQLCNTRMKFQVANGEVLSSMGVAHVLIQMYGYQFKLPIFVCDLGDIDCIFGLDAGKEVSFITCG